LFLVLSLANQFYSESVVAFCCNLQCGENKLSHYSGRFFKIPAVNEPEVFGPTVNTEHAWGQYYWCHNCSHCQRTGNLSILAL